MTAAIVCVLTHNHTVNFCGRRRAFVPHSILHTSTRTYTVVRGRRDCIKTIISCSSEPRRKIVLSRFVNTPRTRSIRAEERCTSDPSLETKALHTRPCAASMFRQDFHTSLFLHATLNLFRNLFAISNSFREEEPKSTSWEGAKKKTACALDNPKQTLKTETVYAVDKDKCAPT